MELEKNMKRIDKVYQTLESVWSHATREELLQAQGSSASEIAELSGYSRSNVSSELNKLVREEKVIKITSFPVCYLPICVLRNILQWKDEIITYEVSNIRDILIQENNMKQDDVQFATMRKNPFDLLIGNKGSFKKQISLAKAAIHYPPHGLHMLLLGETGVGKTLFANRIYEYAIFENIITNDAPFISFNCADYAQNPQLLMSQLFGHTKGLFTGADEDKKGLIEKADNGILLLDEVHRMPPEGQEMLFCFIDKNTFKRMGEVDIERRANVLIICATTENPSSTLLSTFLRRIPMSIHLPSLVEKDIAERVQLAKHLFSLEAKRIERKLQIHIDVFHALLSNPQPGNIGQLKSNIQIICATAFVSNFHNTDCIDITVQNLPDAIQTDWLEHKNLYTKKFELSKYVDILTFISPIDEKDELPDDSFDLYKMMKDKIRILEEDGISEDKIQEYIVADLRIHVRDYFSCNQSSYYSILKFIDSEIITLAERLENIARKKLNKNFDHRFLYFVSMHIDSYMKRGENADLLSPMEVDQIIEHHYEEYQVAQLFQKEIEDTLHIRLPHIEVIYLTMLVYSIRTLNENQKVSILVAMHGNSTASSMVKVARDLLGDSPVYALDMPLLKSPNDMFEEMAVMIRSIDHGKGVLLLVDMGSLAMHEESLKKASNCEIKTISNVTTLMVLDAARKVDYLQYDLNGLYRSINNSFHHPYVNKSEGKMKAILCICTTGSGAAIKLKEMIAELVMQYSEENVEVINVSMMKMDKEIETLKENYHLIAAVGTKQPKLKLPYISLEKFIEGSGADFLIRQITGKDVACRAPVQENCVMVNLVEDTLKTYLVFLNPHIICEILVNWLDEVSMLLEHTYSNTVMIRCLVHTALAVERIVKDNQLDYDEEPSDKAKEVFPVISETLDKHLEQLHLSVCKGEKLYIAETLVF